MPITYSINIGQLIESTRKPDIFTVLQDLPDNTKKLISPRDVRDAFLSVWANSTIKLTTPANFSSFEYIGVDSGNPDNRDIKNKILLGKRSVGNLDIMNSTLLNSDTDIFFYNTKPDTVTQSSTKIGFLSGTNKTLFPYAPYIEANSVTGSRVDFNINNPSVGGGAINISSDTGRVSINGIVFPTSAESSASASNGRVLKYYGTYPNGYLKWADPIPTLTIIGSPGKTTSIYGNPVLLNGYSLEFSNDDLVPVTLGGITQGSSFPKDSFTAGGYTTPGSGQNWPMTEVIRKILYPYIEPTLQLSVNNESTNNLYAERGYPATISVTYSITSYARNQNEFVSHYFLRIGSASNYSTFSSGSFSGMPGTTLNSSFIYATSSSAVIDTWSAIDFNLYASTMPGITNSISYPFGFSFSSPTISVKFINPVFCGFTSSIITNTTGLSSLFSVSKKQVVPYPGASNSISFGVTGSGYFYLAYPSSFATNLKRVKDPNGFIIHDSSFYSSSAFGNTFSTIASPSPYTLTYRLWRIKLPTNYTGPGEFEFTF